MEVGGEGSLFPMGRWVVRGHYSYGDVGGGVINSYRVGMRVGGRGEVVRSKPTVP